MTRIMRIAALLLALALVPAGVAEEAAQDAPAAEAEASDAAVAEQVEAVEAEAGAEAVDGEQPGAAFDPAQAGYDGAWMDFEDGFKLYLPADWAYAKVTEAQAAAGLFYRACGADGTQAVAVSWMNAGAISTPRDLCASFEALGCVNVAAATLNGLPVALFERSEEDYRGAAFFHPAYPGYILAVYASPLGATADAIIASITPLNP